MRSVVWLAICAGLCSFASSAELPELGTIDKLQRDMSAGHLSSEALVKRYLARIDALDRRGPALRAVLAVNPGAIAQARALDRERREHRIRGPLHGIPLLIKDNIETRDPMPTTAGSLALTANFASEDAPVVAALRAAGAVILGKTNLSEWADFRSNHATSGWSAVGGLVRNPYVLDRTACGSSSGTAAAIGASLAPGGLGTETDGSVTCPASMNGIVGLKPTLGLLSQRGIVPISHSQDTSGPMASSVRGVAMLLTAMAENAGGCTAVAGLPAPTTGCDKLDYVAALDANALQGRRIGVLRFDAGSHPEMEIVFERALGRLSAAGATLIEVKVPKSAPLSAAEAKVLLSYLAQRGKLSNTSIREHDIELALLPLDLSEETIKIAEVRHVSLDAGHISSDLLDRRSQLWVTAPRDEDVRAFVHKLLRGRQANAATAASNDCDFSLKLTHVCSPWLSGEGLTVLGDECLERHGRASAKLLDQVVGASEDAILVVDRDLSEMLEQEGILAARILTARLEDPAEFLEVHLLVLDVLAEHPAQNLRRLAVRVFDRAEEGVELPLVGSGVL